MMEKITFQNITQQLKTYSYSRDRCKDIILSVLGSNPDLLSDPDELCRILQDTEYYKKENVYIPDDYFKLHAIHPIHLLLSLKEGKELYSRLYDLYVFQQSNNPDTLISLINQYKDDPAVTAKQIESFAYDRPEIYSSDVSKTFSQTLYMRNNEQSIHKSLEVIPFAILQEKEFGKIAIMLAAFAELAEEKKRTALLNQASLIIDYCALNTLAIEVELLPKDPIYLSQRLVKRWEKMYLLYKSFEDQGYYLPNYLTEGYNNIRNIISHLQHGEVINPQPENKINPVIIFLRNNNKDEIFWKNLKFSINDSNDLSKVLLLANKVDITSLDSLINNFNLSGWLHARIPPSLHYTLKFPEEANTWLDSKLKNFVKEFMENLELNNLGYIAVCDKENGATTIEVLSQCAFLKDNKCNLISLSTIYPRAQKVLVQLEQKYGIKQTVNQSEKDTQTCHIINNFLQKNHPDTKSTSDNSKKNHPKR